MWKMAITRENNKIAKGGKIFPTSKEKAEFDGLAKNKVLQ